MQSCEKVCYRVLLVAAQAQNALRMLDKPGLCVCGVADRVQEALRMLPSLQPHAVIFIDPLPFPDRICRNILDLLPTAPPRIICRRNAICAADAVFDANDPASLSPAVFAACDAPMGLLAQPSFERRYSLALSLLDALGMSPSLKGRACIACAAAWLSAFPRPVPPAQYLLYPHLAKSFDTTPAAMERRIRGAVESTWLHGNLQSQSDLFGLTVSAERGKPTNAEFLSLLSEHLIRLLG